MINVFQPAVGERESAAVAEVLRSGWLGRGPQTEAFEAAFARHLGVEPEQLQTVTSCTEGLFHAVAALGLAAGDEVVLPSVSYVGAANAVQAAGATPVFCDVDARRLNPALAMIEAVATPRTRAVLLMHYGGVPHELEEIADWCRERSIHLVEDAANSVASRVGGRACGTFGDVGVWSFDAMKTIVTGEGGMVWCRDPGVRRRLELQTTLGLSSFSGLSSPRERCWWRFEVEIAGRRSLFSDVAAALGLVQLARLPELLSRRREVERHYRRALGELDWLRLPPAPPAGVETTPAFFWVQCERRDDLAVHLRRHGVYTTFRYDPLHRQPLYASAAELPGADRAAHTTLLLPQHPGLAESDLDQIVERVRDFAA